MRVRERPTAIAAGVIARGISSRNARVQALPHRWNRLRAAVERLLDERRLSRAGPRSAPTLAGMAEVHPMRWFSARGFTLAMT
jgi:hypothetical protein